MTKQVCPICNREGFLQRRGTSQRIKHYQGFTNGKYSYVYHKLEPNGTKELEPNNSVLGSDSKDMVGRARFELATFRLSVERSSRAELPVHIFP